MVREYALVLVLVVCLFGYVAKITGEYIQETLGQVSTNIERASNAEG